MIDQPDFHKAFVRLLENEGYTLTNDKMDRGGLTKFGISQAAYPNEDIQALTLERAAELYINDYWNPLHCYSLNSDELAFCLFDAGVHSGIIPAIRWLQKSLGDLVVDGVMGPLTIAESRSKNPIKTVARMHGYRLEHMTTLTSWQDFNKGWARRIAHNLQEI